VRGAVDVKVKLNGKIWEYVRVPLKKVDGYCDAPHVKGKKIRVDSRLQGIPELDTNIHEALHAAVWCLDEPTISQTAHDLARMLWRLGYRKIG